MVFSSLLALITISLPFTLAGPFSRRTANTLAVSSHQEWYVSDPNAGNGVATTKYTCMNGPASSFPPIDSWISFNKMWDLQMKYLAGNTNSAQSNSYIQQAILEVASISYIDPRIILATILKESQGKMTVPCTNNGVSNCGIMQAYGSTSGSPTPGSPDPDYALVKLMIQEGVQGTTTGPGIVQHINAASGTNQQSCGNIFAALREYNSGTVNQDDLSDGRCADRHYVATIANLVTGYYNPSNGDPSDSEVAACVYPVQVSSNCAALTSFRPQCSATTAAVAVKAAVSPTDGGLPWHSTAAAPNAAVPDQTTATKDPAAPCTLSVIIAPGDTCNFISGNYGLNTADTMALNPKVNAYCTNLVIGEPYYLRNTC